MNLLKAIAKIFNGRTPYQDAMDGLNAEDLAFGYTDPTIMIPQETVDDYFVRHKVTFSEKLKPGEEVKVRWEFKDGVTQDMLQDILPGCKCTSATWGPKGVQAIFKHSEEKVPENGGVYAFGVTVIFKDKYGKVPNGRGGMMWDTRKKRRVLTFSGTLLP